MSGDDVMVVANYSGLYGSERMLARVVDALAGVFGTQVLLNPSVPVPFDSIGSVPVRRRAFSVVSRQHRLAALLDVPSWWRFLRREAPRALVLNISLVPAPLLAAHALGIPTVVFVRESLVDHPGLFRFYRPFLERVATRIVCNSAYTAAMFSPGHPRVVTIHDCVDAAPAVGAADAIAPSLVYVGRLSERKGLGVLADALAILDDGPEPTRRVPVTMIGDHLDGQAAFVDSLKARMAALRSFDVRWTGFLDAPWVEVRPGAILVAPSILPETFGLTVAEAQRAGMPVVATRVGAYPEIVEDGRTGWTCEPDAPSLARALRCALSIDATAYGALGRAARDAASRFSPDRHREQIRSMMCELFRSS